MAYFLSSFRLINCYTIVYVAITHYNGTNFCNFVLYLIQLFEEGPENITIRARQHHFTGGAGIPVYQ